MIAGATIAVLGATALLQRANALSAKSSEWIDLTTGLDVPGLRNRWIALCERLHLTKEVTATRYWQEIETRHNEPQRHYHTLTHLSELFNYLDSNFGTPVQHNGAQDIAELAIFFHDIVYDPRANDNEEKSAGLFRSFAHENGLGTGLTDQVYDWIVLTKSHSPPTGSSEALRLFLDFDMAILSKPLEGYLDYAAQIRQEYIHVAHDQYCQGRASVLRKFCQNTIYVSDGFKTIAAEQRARENIQLEIAMLEKGNIPSNNNTPPPLEHVHHKKRVLLLGFGNVGRRCVELVLRGVSPSMTIIGISDSQGGLYNTNGIDLPGILEHKKTSNVSAFAAAASNGSSHSTTATSQALYQQCLESTDGLDLVIDVSPVNLSDGGISLPILQSAVSQGISCVLANKAPLVLDYANLSTTARANNARLLFSATVCGGLPVINVGTRDLRGAKFHEISGIFNSTSNYVLTELEKDQTVQQAIKGAQHIGIAEADPSLDIEGFDTANKLIIITNSIMGHNCTLNDVTITGIQHITKADIVAAKARGEVLRLVATSTRESNGSVAMSVKPMSVPQHSFFGQCNNTSMCVRFSTDIFEEIELKTKEEGVYPTSAAVLRDCFDVCGD